jgi:hypothetical protein
MEAMQKRKVERAAKIHFLLTAAFVLLAFILLPLLGDAKRHPSTIAEICSYALVVAAVCLQPISCFICIIGQFLFTPIVALVFMPLWSYFFGLIFVGVKERLNHSPAISQKVF